jgi:hypothetical protein
MKEGRWEFVATVGFYEIRRKRGIPFKMASQVSAVLDFIEEMKQRLRPKRREAARKKL